jgi:hypothetical protein
MCSSVDFPQPEGPSSDTNSPAATSRLMSRKAIVGLAARQNVFETPAIDSALPAPGAAAETAFRALMSTFRSTPRDPRLFVLRGRLCKT